MSQTDTPSIIDLDQPIPEPADVQEGNPSDDSDEIILQGEDRINGARAFFLKGIDEDPHNGRIWQAWGYMEKQDGNIGDLLNPEEYSARWLFRKGTELDPKCSTLLSTWANAEKEQGNIGEQYDPEDFTARWLFRRAVEANPRDSVAWRGWAILEKEQRNSGDRDNPEEYTARWLFRKTERLHHGDTYACLVWGLLEKEQGYIGDKDEPEKYTARWLFRHGITNDRNAILLVHTWAALEASWGNPGTPGDPEKFSARWLLRKATKIEPDRAKHWGVWAAFEKAQENWEEAERLYLEQIRLARQSKDRSRLYQDLSYMFHLVVDRDRAVKYLELAIKEAPDNHHAQARLARNYARLRRWGDAERHFVKALELCPGDAKAEEWYADMKKCREKSSRRR